MADCGEEDGGGRKLMEHLPDLPISRAFTIVDHSWRHLLSLVIVVQLILTLVCAAWLVSDNARTAATYERYAAACSVVAGK